MELQCSQVIMPLARECARAVRGVRGRVQAQRLPPDGGGGAAGGAQCLDSPGEAFRFISGKAHGMLADLKQSGWLPGAGLSAATRPARPVSAQRRLRRLFHAQAAAVRDSAAYNAQLAPATEAVAAWVEEMALAYKAALLLTANVLSIVAQAQLIPLRDGLLGQMYRVS